MLTAVLPILLAATCSVKEDRGDCPCVLTVDTQEAVEGDMVLNIVHQAEGIVCQEEIGSYQGSFSAEVPKGVVCVTAFGNYEGWEISADGLQISLSEGLEPGRIYAHSDLVECYGEKAWDSIVMYKQWCTLTVVLDAAGNWEDCSFTLEGKWNGFLVEDFSATAGSFSCPMALTSEGTVEARATRQGDDSLVIRISQDGQTDRLRAVGKAMAEAGYNWGAPSLDDATVLLSDCAVEVDLNASDWVVGDNDENPVI